MDQKIIDLEVRLAWQENHIEELDKVAFKQQQLITMLTERIDLLEKRLKIMGESNILRPEEDSPPPHY